MTRRACLFLLILFLTPGCTLSRANSQPTPMPGAFVTGAPAPTAAVLPDLPTVVPTPAIVVTPTPFAPFQVEPLEENLKLRVNPGYLFEALRLVQPGDKLTVQGKAPGGEWIFVETTEGEQGWVFAQFLKSSVSLRQIPVIQPENVQLVKGRVTDMNGTPVDGVNFSLTQGTGDNPIRTEAATDENGDFYAFFPPQASGDWTITYVAVACTSVVWQGGVCGQYKTGYSGVVTPESTAITLPKTDVVTFLFK